LFWVEAGNAIASRVRRGELDHVRGSDALRDLQDAPLQTRPLDARAALAALAIANELAHPIYDCCYLSLALEEDAIVVTADRRFRSRVAAHPSLTDRVLLLRDIVMRPERAGGHADCGNRWRTAATGIRAACGLGQAARRDFGAG
jgi:predicted nucleic acid-binding protein